MNEYHELIFEFLYHSFSKEIKHILYKHQMDIE